VGDVGEYRYIHVTVVSDDTCFPCIVSKVQNVVSKILKFYSIS
jgi:hypothetical protein